MRNHKPQVTMTYLPHLDYDFQRFPEQDPERVAELDACAGQVIEAAEDINAKVVVISEYGLVPVSRPIHINRHLREMGLLRVRSGPFGEMMLPGDSEAFAVSDHQIAHIYVKDISRIDLVAKAFAIHTGVARIALYRTRTQPPSQWRADCPLRT